MSVRPVVSSVFAGSSYTTRVVAHSNASRRSRTSEREVLCARLPGRRPLPNRTCVDLNLASSVATSSGGGCATRLAAGYADGLFQYKSNWFDTSRTAGPTAITSRSTKTTPSPAPKYSLPMLRPPTIVTWLSTVNDLLCMRRLTRRKVRHEIERAHATLRKRVVEAHFDVRMRVEHRDDGIESARVDVVKQQAHAHAALRRLQECLEEQVTDLIGVPDVVLHIERLFGVRGEKGAGGESVMRLEQRVNTRLAGIGRDTCCHRATKPSLSRVCQSGRGRAALE